MLILEVLIPIVDLSIFPTYICRITPRTTIDKRMKLGSIYQDQFWTTSITNIITITDILIN